MIDVRSAGFIKNGFLDSWLKYCEPFEFPESYALFALLGCASIAIDGRVLVNPTSEPCVKTNTYTLLIGPSGARKSTAARHAVWLLAEAVPEAPVLPRSFTVEIAKLRLAKKSLETGKGDGLILADEFSDLVAGAKYKEGATKFFTDIWDCPPVYSHDTVAHDYVEIVAPYIVGLWCSAPDWIYSIAPEQLAGGFLRRVLGVVEYGARRRNDDPKRNMALFQALAKRMHETLGLAAFDEGTAMRLDASAIAAKKTWYHEALPKYHKFGEKEGHFASCMEAHALKLAAGIHLLEGGDPKWLTAISLETAQKLVEVIVPNLFSWYSGLAPTPFARLKASIVRTLNGAEGEMSEWRLAKAVQGATGAKPAEYIVALEALAGEAQVVREGGKVKCRT